MSVMTYGSTQDLADTAAFIRLIEDHRTFFIDERAIIVTRAPGRLDLIGGIADYSGSLVLELPIASGTHVAIQTDSEKTIRMISLPSDNQTPERIFEIQIADLFIGGAPLDYATACLRFEGDPQQRWAAYVVGAFVVLMREQGLRLNSGARILISSTVPEGAGVSSSAALEVAVMRAVAAAHEVDLSGAETAFLCQKVENLVAGAPCGVMDQMTVACGEKDRLLALLCQPGKISGTIRVPAELGIWGIDSGIRHSVRGAAYRTVRTAAFMGYRMIADIAGLLWRKTATEGLLEIDDPRWAGYLANLTPDEFERSFARRLPLQISGAEFLARYEGITDTVTSVRPDLVYPVLEATRHPIDENRRVMTFVKTLQEWNGLGDAEGLGELMSESHASYSRCGLGSAGTDELVAAVKEVGLSGGLFGAKITGGGSGGTVAVLGNRDAEEAVRRIALDHAARAGHGPVVFSGSSPGAVEFGHLRVKKKTHAKPRSTRQEREEE